jgi:two-component system response regulator
MGSDVGTILLVEDNPRDEELTLLAFEDSHIANEVVVARDGVEALDYLFGTGTYHGRAVEDLPSVVLLDLKLPKVGGLEVLERIRGDERTALLPVTVLTSSDEERDMIRSYQLGVNSYIQKPVDFDQFIQATKTLGLYWVVLNQVPFRRRRR